MCEHACHGPSGRVKHLRGEEDQGWKT